MQIVVKQVGQDFVVPSLESCTLIQPAFVDLVKSRKFHFIESDTFESSRTKLLVDKTTGQGAIGEVYDDPQEAGAAKKRYKALFKTLKKGAEKILIPFLEESTTDGYGYMIISEYWWQAKTLSELIEEEILPPPPELSFIFAQINQAVAYLHSQGIIHRNISPKAILWVLASYFGGISYGGGGPPALPRSRNEWQPGV